MPVLYTFVYPKTINWTRLRQRPQQLLRALAAAGHTCFFCDLPMGRQPAEMPMTELEPQLYLVHNQATLKRSDLPADQPVVLLFTLPGTERLAEQIGADAVLFDHVDEAAEEFAVWAGGLPGAIKAADAMLVVSERLQTLFAGQHRNVTLVRNGATVDDFAAAAEGRLRVPDEMVPIKERGPVIGFYGALASWLDWELLRDLATARPGWQLVLIGPEYSAGCAQVVTGLPNVHLLGEKIYEELPAYAQVFDAAILPFQVRDMTNSANPVKVYEYLAAGLPVVATPIQEMQHLAPAVETAGTVTEFAAACERAMSLRHDERAIAHRLQVAKDNSWTVRARQVEAVIDGLYGCHTPIPKVMIGAPVRNRAWVLPQYLEALEATERACGAQMIQYTWVVNDCTDGTEAILQGFADRHPGQVRLIRYDLGARATPSEQRGQYSYHHLAELRNVLLDAFLESDAEYLLSLDTDLLLPSTVLRRLTGHGADAVSALVNNSPTGQPAWNIMRLDPGRPGSFERIWNPPADGVIPVDLTGACMLIHRRVIEAGVRYSHHPQGEDGGFCLAAKAAGFSIAADCSIRCRHVMIASERG